MKFLCSCGRELKPEEFSIPGQTSILRGGYFSGYYVMGYCKNPEHFIEGTLPDRLYGFKVEIFLTHKQAKKIKKQEKKRKELRRREHIGRIE